MENLSYSSYPESGDSSPLTREIDDNQSWDDTQQATYKVKLMCSYGGKIQPRPHDNQLAYVGGDTKILAVDRNVKFSVILNKLTSLSGDNDVCIKYQLPGEDLDALISVTNDEDLEHMMLEYDRLFRASVKPARLRIFLFHLNPSNFGSDDAKSDRQWYVNALNAVSVQNNPEGSSPPAAAPGLPPGNAEFLFRLDKRLPPVPITKFMDTSPAQPTVPEIIGKSNSVGSDGSEDRIFVGDPMVNQQISDLQRLQISAANEQILNRKLIEDANNKAYAMEQYQQKVEKIAPAPAPAQMMMPAGYMPERQMAYAISTPVNEQQTFYQVPTVSGAYQAQTMRTMTGGQQVGQGYYEVFKEQQMYNPGPGPAATSSIQQQKVGVYNDGMGMMQTRVGVAEQGYMQVGYDASGRQVYYTMPYQAQGPSQATAASPVFSTMNQDGKVQVVMAPQTSSG
ncbi:Octicosapeptide/Phox/Bem1p family protein [Euphorbia peplus]|nr:Octicosapeptide/Phox/Bem1p family protein [Euphorbia peplus]